MSDEYLGGAGAATRLEYPPPVATESAEARVTKLSAWLKNCVDYTAVRRMRQWVLWRLADLFFDGDQTNLMPEFIGYAGEELSRMLPPDELWLGGDGMPTRPVLNEYKDAVLNEQTRLDKSDYEPTVRPQGQDPSYQDRVGAKASTRALRNELKRMGWSAKKRLVSYHLPSYGGAWLVSYWDKSLEKTKRFPKKGCSQCPGCGCKYGAAIPGAMPGAMGNCPRCQDHEVTRPATQEDFITRAAALPPEMLPPEGMPPAPEVLEQLHAPVTERAPGPPQLEPYEPSEDELYARGADDVELGEDIPIGEWKIDVLWPGEVFEADFGVGAMGEHVIRDVTLVRVKSLDYLRARWANARTKELKPENAGILTQYHPVGGELSYADETRIWRDSARLIQRIKLPYVQQVYDERGLPVLGGPNHDQPTFRMSPGHIVSGANGVILEDDANPMLTGPDGEVFPSIHVEYVPHDVLSGGLFREGSSLGRQLQDAQRLVNYSAELDLDEQRNGQSRWIAPTGANVRFETPDGNAGALVLYDVPEGEGANPQNWAPELVSRTAGDQKWGATAQGARNFIERASRRTEVEGGGIPGPTTAAQAMQIAREESGEIRRPRVKALAECYERLFRHGLQLMQVKVHTPRVAWDKTDSGKEFQTYWVGADFRGQTDVRIDIEGAEDTELLKQQKLTDAIDKGLVDLLDPRQRRVMAKLKGVPAEIYEVENEQEQLAEREYLEFTRGCEGPSGQVTAAFGAPPCVDDGLDSHELHIYRHKKDMQSDLWRELERLVGWDAVLKVIGGWKAEVAFAMSQPIQPGVLNAPPVGIDGLLPTPQEFVLALWVQKIGMAAAQPNSQLKLTPALAGMLAFRAHLVDHQLRMAAAMAPPVPPQPMPQPGAPAAGAVPAGG